jgi:hypothetical protein
LSVEDNGLFEGLDRISADRGYIVAKPTENPASLPYQEITANAT